MIDAAKTTAAFDSRPKTAREQLRTAADQLVGSVFYGTLLRRMRSSEIQGPYGHGGQVEKMFQGQLDQILAERAGAARSTNLTDAIMKRYARKAEMMATFSADRPGDGGGAKARALLDEDA